MYPNQILHFLVHAVSGSGLVARVLSRQDFLEIVFWHDQSNETPRQSLKNTASIYIIIFFLPLYTIETGVETLNL